MAKVDQKVARCEEIVQHTFVQKRTCIECLSFVSTAVSYAGTIVRVRKNDSLAILGEAVLNLKLCERWIRTGRSLGEWTVIREEVAGNPNLARIGKALDFDTVAILNPGTLAVSDKMTSTLVKAVIGAVHRDGNDRAVELLVARLGLDHENLDLPRVDP